MVLEKKGREEYLERMYRKKEKGERITTTSIAKELSVSPASVSQMFKKLEKGGFIKLTPYKGAELTKKGEKAGKKIVEKHRLIEKFLMIFGVGKGRAHKDACEIEHALSDESKKAFERAIKLSHLRPENKKIKPLVELKEGERGRIEYIEGGTGVCRRVMELGLTRGTVVKVLRSSKYGCPVGLEVRGAEVAIGKGIASKIYVEVME
jgi:DtxR family Mn-dependent transcriptional regulator